ncbi:MAG: amino acid-binding protein [Deltaproteobacteria bacterium]|nr:amino acid-binding protein [Deltaproteobacteria bacterium]
MKRFALTAIGADTPGIVAGITSVLFEYGCNIEDSSMTRLEEEFSVILIMTTADDIKTAELEKEIKEMERGMGLEIHFKEIGEKPLRKERASTHMVTVSGYDRPGIVYKTADLLAGCGINITDLTTRMLHGHGRSIYIMLMEVSLPKTLDGAAVAASLKTLGDGMGVKIEMKPIETHEAL